MIGFHLQNSPQGWPDAVRRLPAGTPVKFVFGVERCREAKAVNPAIKTWYRWVGGQPLPDSNYEAHARAWLNQFIDGTFRREAAHVDYVGDYNETLANSQSPEEKARWLALHTAMAKVWHDEYRKEPALSHIRMTLCATAVGNDIPVEFARAAVQYDALLDYHPYIFTEYGKVRSDDWRWFSGRWAAMDDEYRRRGVFVDWIFGEMGPFRDAKSGWRHPDVLNGNVDDYIGALAYWLDHATQTPAWQDGRVHGGVLFTSGSPGDEWKWFDTRQPEMNAIADFVRLYEAAPPTPEPPPPVATVQPRAPYGRHMLVVPQDATLEQWLDVCRDAYANRRTVGFSYDDAGYGAPSDKVTIKPLSGCTAVLYRIPAARRAEFLAWYATHYPGTVVQFAESVTTGLEEGALGVDISQWQARQV